MELPNTLGMSQRADGGLIATKPYVSSAAYLQRMGDYCQGCAYHPKQKDRPTRLPLQRPVLGLFCPPCRDTGQQPPAGAGVPPMAKNAATSSKPPCKRTAQQVREQLGTL